MGAIVCVGLTNDSFGQWISGFTCRLVPILRLLKNVVLG